MNLDAGIFNFLVGESIVRSDDPVRFIRELMRVPSGGTHPGNGLA
jgi:hypothetical protein